MVGDKGFDIEILAETENETEAFDLEESAISQLRPTCNVRSRGWLTALGSSTRRSKKEVLHVRVESRLKKQLKAVAKKRKISVAELVIVEMEKALE